MKLLTLILLSIFPLTAFANVSDTVCDVDGADISFDIGSSTPLDTGPRPFYALEVGKKGHLNGSAEHQILANASAYRIAFNEEQGDFSLRITSRTQHKLVFSAQKKTLPDGSVKTDASSSIKGFSFPTATFSCK
jgi:hypothetical protein